VEGSINLPYGADWASATVLDQLEDTKTIVLICHTGHRASFLTLYLRQLGYDAYAMMYGMMGWTSDIGVIGIPSTFCTAGAGNWPTSTTAVPAPEDYDIPLITSDLAGDEVIMELTGDYLGADPAPAPVVTGSDIYNEVVVGGSTDYALIDVRPQGDYDNAHIEGAIAIPYGSWTDPDVLLKVPDDVALVTICYTGHTASQIAMLLGQLGYEAYAMAYGYMGWTDDTGIIGFTGICSCDANYPTVTN
jgi:rhodanese-related sulfurtransferase